MCVCVCVCVCVCFTRSQPFALTVFFQVLGANSVFDVKPVLLRAFNAAKALDGSSSGPSADYVQLREFHALLLYIRSYFEYWVMFHSIDTNDDRRLSFVEFTEALGEIQKWGIVVTDPVSTFRKIDKDGSISRFSSTIGVGFGASLT